MIIIHYRENCDFQQRSKGPPNESLRQLQGMKVPTAPGALKIRFREEIGCFCSPLNLSIHAKFVIPLNDDSSSSRNVNELP